MEQRKTKQQRYDELAAMDTDLQSDDEIEEQTQLFYELNPDAWNALKSGHSQRTPKDQWSIDTSMYL